MRNPFTEMAIMAAAMAAAFRENIMRDAGTFGKGRGGKGHGGSKRKASHDQNPAGAKIARRFLKHVDKDWNGEVAHTGALTAASDARAGRAAGWAKVAAITKKQSEAAQRNQRGPA